MQIVIDISEEDYNFVKRQVADGITNRLKICIAIGTPLPKGHGRLIDVNEVIKIANKTKDLDGAIWNAPTIIESDKSAIEDAIPYKLSEIPTGSDDELYSDCIDAFKEYALGRK